MVGCTLLGEDKQDTVLDVSTKFDYMSDEAVFVLAKTLPIGILVDDMRIIYLRRFKYHAQIVTIKAEKRRTYMHKWQIR